ncbi:hypothetical protein [Truepera radiovictrix]|uniref:Uncharacterized protein n=1 Tax=Truepera radiovictrix (strain DSM 17093 / CIP 108686 / LMG 22925 / RQ-24) TaxID=649638 RepID=D7CT24_TRURR|nr:hypothetical protein [Truepera radiovictrix]ADI15487.1 hypothetical protein Trad_2378 [Truepera radiovictrix DSM 17093]WMT55962.1 hypothetical protein RCV51_08025 [Truepera radiovictrix]
MSASAGSPLNLLHLAKGDPGAPQTVPGTALQVQALAEPTPLDAAPMWLALLAGELIVDLPHGDFRLLKVGECLTLHTPSATLTPLDTAVVLRCPLGAATGQ